MSGNRLDEKEAEIHHPKQRTPSVILVLKDHPPGLELQPTPACAVVFKLHWCLLLFSPARQFRSRRSDDPVPYHTRVAAGIKATSHFSPPNMATRPKQISSIVPPT